MTAERRIVLALCVVLGGCVYTPEDAPAPAPEPPVQARRPVVITTTKSDDAELVQYVSLKRQAAESDEAQWRALYEDAKTNAGLSARDRRLRLALLLGAPNRPEPDWNEAERLLETLLQESGRGVSLPMRDLLTVSKHEIVKRGRLAERMKQLENRQNELAAEVKRLQQELAEAMEKIQALTKIEKSIERPKNSEIR